MRKRFTPLFILLFSAIILAGQDLSNIKQQKPFGISGGLSLGSYLYGANGIPSRQAPFGYSVNANATLSFYGLSVPFSVVFNEQGRRFQQPFNRYGLSPTWKWGKIHLGHRNLNLSPFTLAGQTMYMAGLELTPGKLRFAAATGRFYNAVGSGDPNFQRPRFKRSALALKLGAGGKNGGFFDVIFLKGKDDINSLPNEPDSVRAKLKAQENAVIGLSFKQPFAKQKLTLQFDGAASTFTEDLRFEPIDFSQKAPQVENIGFIIQPNGSSHINYALESSLRWESQRFGLAATYRRVMPEYKSMGVNYLLTDIEAITLNPSLILGAGKTVVSGSIGLERNNLDQHKSEDTRRTIGSLDLSMNPSPVFGFFAQYSNYTVQQQVFREEFSNDSILINQINHNFTLAPRYTILGSSVQHTLLLTLNYQILDDQNQFTAEFTENDLVNVILTYMASFPGTGMNIRGSLNHFRFSSDQFENSRIGFTAGLNKKFGESGLTLGSDVTFSSINQQHRTGTNITASALLDFAFGKRNSISLQVYYLKNNLPSFGFSEVRGQARYNYRF